MVLSGLFAFWDYSNKLSPCCLPRASKGRVDVEHQGSCQVPRTARAAFIPFCSERGLSLLRWRAKGCGDPAVSSQVCPMRAVAVSAASLCLSVLLQ